MTGSLAGVLDLVQGIAEIEFAGGAVMLLEAPVRVELVDPRRAVLRFGHVVVRVPERAIGFVVATARAEIVDLGTEFGVAVGPADDTLVEVFKGEVVAKLKGEGGRETTRNHLAAGQAVRFDNSAGSSPRKVRSEPGRFVRTFPADVVSPPSGPLYNRSRIDSVHVVPAPPGVIVDGSLSDWDMSGIFRSECVAPYGEHHYVEGAMMYDDRYVYIGAHVGDPHPMRSIQDPYTDPEYPWRGGSVIVRLAASRSLGWPLRGLSPYFRSADAPEIGGRPVDVERQHRPPGPVVLPAGGQAAAAPQPRHGLPRGPHRPGGLAGGLPPRCRRARLHARVRNPLVAALPRAGDPARRGCDRDVLDRSLERPGRQAVEGALGGHHEPGGIRIRSYVQFHAGPQLGQGDLSQRPEGARSRSARHRVPTATESRGTNVPHD